MGRPGRSRNGCVRCKYHRLKCDEAWPVCGRCSRLRVECSGPRLQWRWSHKHEVSVGYSGAIEAHNKEGTINCPSQAPPCVSHDVWEEPSEARGGLAHGQGCSAQPNDDSEADEHHKFLELDITEDLSWFEHMICSPPFQLRSSGNGLPVPVSTTPESLDDTLGEVPEGLPECQGTASSSRVSISHMPRAAQDFPYSQDLGQTNDFTLSHHSIQKGLVDVDSVLVQIYFRDTARILSVYDGEMNPFRSTVSRLWDSSEIIYYALQSMAAISLADLYPHMLGKARKLRQKALASLKPLDQASVDEKTLIALMMIGGTASWFNDGDTGVSLFNLFSNALHGTEDSLNLVTTCNNKLFFQDALICWRALLSFVVDDDKLDWPQSSADPHTLGTISAVNIFPTHRVPHPWTGVDRDAHVCLGRVGRLIRTNRRNAYKRSFLTQATIDRLQKEAAEARELEEALLSGRPITEAEVVNSGDNQTPSWHLLTLSNVYRRIGLLQLYRVFPDVLAARMRRCPKVVSDLGSGNASGPIHSSWEKDHGNRLPPKLSCDDWLTDYAVSTVSLLKSIPAESGTSDFQPFLLVACCSELRCTNPASTKDLSSEMHLTLRDIEVFQSRRFILGRLDNLMQLLPGGFVRRCIQIVKSTWSKLDERADGLHPKTYWMDVMIENGWDTLMA